MDKAIDKNGKLVNAKDVYKNIFYTCPCCGEDVFKVEGKKQSAHFRHRRGYAEKDCENYIKRLSDSNSYYTSDYVNLCKEPAIVIEEQDGNWDLFIRFPYLNREQAMKCDQKSLDLRIRCHNINGYLSTTHIWPNSNENKLKITPQQKYTFSFEPANSFQLLGLNWRKFVNGFREEVKVYIFQLVRNEYCLVEPGELSLNELFYIIVRQKLSFPKNLLISELNKKHGWYAYKVQLPKKLDQQLFDWFETYSYQLKLPSYYIDLLVPSTYTKKGNSFFLNQSSCILQISFLKSIRDKYTLVQVNPDFSLNEYRTLNKSVRITIEKNGFYTFFIKNHQGKMLHLYFNEEPELPFQYNYHSNARADQKVVKLFGNKQVDSNLSFEVLHNDSFVYWLKEKNKFPQQLIPLKSYHLKDVYQIYIPGIWSFQITTKDSSFNMKLDWRMIFVAYTQMERYKSCWLTNEQYNHLQTLVNQIDDNDSLKIKLKFLIKLHRNQVPHIVRQIILKSMEDTA